MSKTTILLTGATGYVGGTTLEVLRSSKIESIKNAEISVLVRGKDKAATMEAKGVKPILFESFEDHEIIRKAANEHSLVLHTASGFHTGIAKSLLEGLAERKIKTGKEVYYMHISGTSNVSDSPILGLYPEYSHGIWHDSEPLHTLENMKHMNGIFSYPQRNTDLMIVDTSQKTGIKTYIFICPMLYGEGLGDYHKLTHQIPDMMRRAAKDGYAWIVGEGKGVKNHIHIIDLARLFETFLAAILEGKDVPHGECGIFFAENGEHSWRDVGIGIAKAGVELGILKSDEVKSLTLEEAHERLDWHDKVWVESGFVASSRTKADIARSLGWEPVHPDQDFETHYVNEWKVVMREDEKWNRRINLW